MKCNISYRFHLETKLNELDATLLVEMGVSGVNGCLFEIVGNSYKKYSYNVNISLRCFLSIYSSLNFTYNAY